MQILTTSPPIVPTSSPVGSDSAAVQRDATAIDWQQSMRHAVRSVAELRRLLNLPPANPIEQRAENEFATFVSREYLSRIEPGNPRDPLLLQVMPTDQECEAVAGFVDDPVDDGGATLVPGLLQKYGRRVLLIATGVCGVHCRYCFRRQYDYSLPASILSAAGDESWRPAIDAIGDRPEIDEVILSGGDPLTLSDAKLNRLIDALEPMAHVRRLRFHTRMPIVIPQRVTEALLHRLRRSRLATWMVIHCNHAAEIDGAVEGSLRRLIDAGIPLLNQAVLLRGVNDSLEALESLCRRLVDLRVQPYYLHQLDRVKGAAHFEVALETGRSLIEQLRERLPGYAVPLYVCEQPGRSSKTAL